MTQFHVWYVTTGITFVSATNLENRQESCTDSSFKLRTTNTVIQDENEELLLPEIPGLAVISHYSKSLSIFPVLKICSRGVALQPDIEIWKDITRFSFLRQLSTRHCSHLLLSAVLRRRCFWAPGGHRPTRTALSSKPAARRGCGRMVGVTDRQADGRSTVS